MLEEKIREKLIFEEGKRNNIYRCSEGYLTVGVGHKITNNDVESVMEEGDYIDDDRIEYLLKRDMNFAIIGVDSIFAGHDIPDEIRLVMTDMCFQLGKTGLSKFKKMIKAIKEKDYELAAYEALNSKWAVQTPNRAKRNAEILRKI